MRISCLFAAIAAPLFLLPAIASAMSNPASEACAAAGGKLEILRQKAGETGICRFPDGSACEEWAYLRGQCTQGMTHLPTADPFLYCRAMGNIDAPGPLWAGPRLPDSVARGLQQAMKAPQTPRKGVYWRCMDGAVHACAVGANLPCTAKADTSRTPSDAMREFCRKNKDVDFIPTYVTGRETVHAWRCAAGTPQIDSTPTEVDARGYRADIWYRIER